MNIIQFILMRKMGKTKKECIAYDIMDLDYLAFSGTLVTGKLITSDNDYLVTDGGDKLIWQKRIRGSYN